MLICEEINGEMETMQTQIRIGICRIIPSI